jgi:hypothetical protein
MIKAVERNVVLSNDNAAAHDRADFSSISQS